MKYVIENCKMYNSGAFSLSCDFSCDLISDTVSSASSDTQIIRGNNLYIFPGFTDVHVHLREPGFSYKETVRSGTLASAHGGYTRVCSMPNLNPCPDSCENLAVQEKAIAETAVIGVLPYGTITKGQAGEILSDMEEMADRVIAFSDDGRGVQDDDVMKTAMLKAKQLGKMIVSHCEDNTLLRGGYIHDGEYARLHGHRGICSESEWRAVERDLRLVRETGCRYHVCHVSAAETVELVRQAKREGLDVSCETGPHYLILDDMMLGEDGRFKMNPPIRSARDRDALIEGIIDGTIEMIATDHAPHSAEEKGRGLEKSLMGVVGIETAFPMMYEYLVKPGMITLEKLVALLHDNPCRRFGIENEMKNNFTVFDLGEEYTVDPAEFLSMGKATPFAGMKASGRCRLTVSDGRVAYLKL